MTLSEFAKRRLGDRNMRVSLSHHLKGKVPRSGKVMRRYEERLGIHPAAWRPPEVTARTTPDPAQQELLALGPLASELQFRLARLRDRRPGDDGRLSRIQNSVSVVEFRIHEAMVAE